MKVRYPVERRRVSGTVIGRVTRALLTARFIAGTPSAPAAFPLAQARFARAFFGKEMGFGRLDKPGE